MRTTTITITSVFDDYPALLTERLALCQVVHQDWFREYKKAMQYLVGYGFMNYDRIVIHTDAYGEMTAGYYVEGQERAAFIQGAVPRWSNLPDKPFEFTFHS